MNTTDICLSCAYYDQCPISFNGDWCCLDYYMPSNYFLATLADGSSDEAEI